MLCDSKEGVMEYVVDEDFEDNLRDANYIETRMLLAITNKIVDELNNEMVTCKVLQLWIQLMIVLQQYFQKSCWTL